MNTKSQNPPKQTAKLTDWCVHKHRDGDQVLFGFVQGHPKLSDGIAVATSTLVNIDIENNTAETRNTTYELVGETSEKGRDKYIKNQTADIQYFYKALEDLQKQGFKISQ